MKKNQVTISFVEGSRRRRRLVTTSTILSWSCGNLFTSITYRKMESQDLKRQITLTIILCTLTSVWIFFIVFSIHFPPPSSKIGHISQGFKARNCASDNIIHNTWLKACCTILCISSWTSSTHRRLGSSSRRICLLTKSSNEISGTNKAGRGPCEQKQKKFRFEGNSYLGDLIKLRSNILPLRF